MLIPTQIQFARHTAEIHFGFKDLATTNELVAFYTHKEYFFPLIVFLSTLKPQFYDSLRSPASSLPHPLPLV
jgi:hypothetical protein